MFDWMVELLSSNVEIHAINSNNMHFDGEWLDMSIVMDDNMDGRWGDKARSQLRIGDCCRFMRHNFVEFTFLPMDWIQDDNEMTFFDYHAFEDRAADRVDVPRTGPITLKIKGDELLCHIYSDKQKESDTNKGLKSDEFRKKISFITPTKVRMEYFPTPWPNNNPNFKLFLGGQLVFESHKANAYNDKEPPYIKIGPYQWSWYEGFNTYRIKFKDIRFGSG